MLFLISILLAAAEYLKADITHLQTWDILMPNVSIHTNDSFLCYSVKVNTTQPMYLAGFVPILARNIQHDVLTACHAPGSNDAVWSCEGIADPFYKSGRRCQTSPQYTLYVWDIDGEGFFLPPDTGLVVGGNTGYSYIVLQVHYVDIQKRNDSDAETDTSGIRLYYTHERPQKLAGVMQFFTTVKVPPKQQVYAELGCPIPLPSGSHINIIAYHVHTHALGLVQSAYRVRSRNGQSEWTEIARRSPQLSPHRTLSTNISMTTGDFMATRCTYYNPIDHTVTSGVRWEEEMCVFLAYYITEHEPHVPYMSCSSKGYPSYYWGRERRINLSNPPAEASELPTYPVHDGPNDQM